MVERFRLSSTLVRSVSMIEVLEAALRYSGMPARPAAGHCYSEAFSMLNLEFAPFAIRQIGGDNPFTVDDC